MRKKVDILTKKIYNQIKEIIKDVVASSDCRNKKLTATKDEDYLLCQ